MASTSELPAQDLSLGGEPARSANGALEKDKWAAKWTYADDENMFDVLLDAKERGETNQNGFFKMQVWQDVADAVSKGTTVGGRKDVENCKSRWQRLKKDFKIIAWLKDQPNFGWDADRTMVVASDEVWDAWIEGHPEHKRFRFYRIPQYDAVATLTDEDLPPGHQPVRPRTRPPVGTTALGGYTPFTTFAVPFVPPRAGPSNSAPPASFAPPQPQYIDPNVMRGAEGPHVEDDTYFGSSASTRPTKRRRTDILGNSASDLHEVGHPLAEAIWGLKDSLDDYLDQLAGDRARMSGVTPGPSAKSSRHRKADAINLLLDAELSLSDDDKARIIHIFRRDASAADTYMQLSEISSDNVRNKWIEQLLSDRRAT